MKKRIVFLGYNEPDGKTFGNGVARVIYTQCKELRERGHEVFFYHLFSKEQYKGLNDFLIENRIDVAVWHMTTLKIKSRLHTPCPLICLWHNTPVFRHDTKVFCEKYNVPPIAAKFLETKAINWIYGRIHNLYNILAFLYVVRCADRMVLLSEQFIPIFFPSKVYPKKVVAIHNPIDDHFLDINISEKEKRKEVLYMGRLDNKTKRLDLLLDIWQIIEYKYHIDDWTLNICGDGADRKILEQKKEDLGLRNVVFRGHVAPEDFYKTSSILTLTSAVEGLPTVILEAAACLCVPMAFDSFESVKDLIEDAKTGRIIKAFDVKAYAKALYYLITNDKEREQMAQSARERGRLFGKQTIIDHWEALFDDVIKEKRG